MRWLRVIAILIGVISILYKRSQATPQEDFEENIQETEDIYCDEMIDSQLFNQDEWIEIGSFNAFEAEEILHVLKEQKISFQIQKSERMARRRIKMKITIFVLAKDKNQALSNLGCKV